MDILREERLKRGWRQDEVADKVGVSRTTYASWEQGHRSPDLDTFEQLADLFGCTMDYLKGRSKKRELSEEEDKERSERGYMKVLDDFKNGRVEGYPPEVQTMIAQAMERRLEVHKKEQTNKNSKP